MSNEKKQPLVGSRPLTLAVIASTFACVSMNRRFVSKLIAPLSPSLMMSPVSNCLQFIQFPREFIDTICTGP